MRNKDEIQGYYADCYVLTEKRNYDFIIKILNHFVPNRRETADEYEIPQYSENPTELFDNADEKIRFLSKNKRIKHTLYWENPDKTELKGVELFFTDDEYLICGVYCDTKFPNTEIEDKYFEQLQKICNSKQGYITYEEPSVHNSQEFIEITKKWNLNNRNEEHKKYLLKNKEYKVYLNGKELGTSKLEKGDAPMGVAFGKLDFEDKNYGYSQIRNYCIENKIELAMDYPKDKMISTMTIKKLKVINENGVEIKGVGNQITGMDNEEYEISIFGISYPFYETEFPNLVKEYENKFKEK